MVVSSLWKAAGFALALLFATLVVAQEAPRVVVKVDITETVDDQPSKQQAATYMVRKKLREAGFAAWTTTEHPADAEERELRKKKAAETGATPEPLIDDQKPEPQLVVTGTCVIKFSHDITAFGGEKIGAYYRADLALKILDASGKELGVITDEEKRGSVSLKTLKENKKAARDKVWKFIQHAAAADVLAAEPIQQRLNDKGKAETKRFIDDTAAKRKPKASGAGEGEAGDGTEEK